MEQHRNRLVSIWNRRNQNKSHTIIFVISSARDTIENQTRSLSNRYHCVDIATNSLIQTGAKINLKKIVTGSID
jgi:hypothetical protein